MGLEGNIGLHLACLLQELLRKGSIGEHQGGMGAVESCWQGWLRAWAGHLGAILGWFRKPKHLHFIDPSSKKLGSIKCRFRHFFSPPKRAHQHQHHQDQKNDRQTTDKLQYRTAANMKDSERGRFGGPKKVLESSCDSHFEAIRGSQAGCYICWPLS